MNRLFWGIFFVLIDYRITIGTAVLDILPDFAGFYLTMKAMESMAERSKGFDRARHLAFGMTVLSIILFVMELMNPGLTGKLWLTGLGLVGQVVTILILYGTVRGMGETGCAGKQECDRLKLLWLVVSVLGCLAQILQWVPLVGKVCTAAATLGSLCFLAAMYGSIARK